MLKQQMVMKQVCSLMSKKATKVPIFDVAR